MLLFSSDTVVRFSPSLWVQSIDEDVLLILTERKRSIIRGRAIVQVAQNINGQRTVADIVAALDGQLDEASVQTVLEQLAHKGYLGIGAAPTDTPAHAFWELMQADAITAQRNLDALTVTIHSMAGISPQPLTDVLAYSGITVTPHGRLHIALTDDYLRPELATLAAQAAAAGVALLLVQPSGSTPTIGPLIHAEFGSCLVCLQHALRLNRPVQTWLHRHQHQGHLPLALQAGSQHATYGLVAHAITLLYGTRQDRSQLKDHLLALDLQTLQTQRHAVTRRPQCSHCGDATLMAQQAHTPVQLQPSTAMLRREGGYRVTDPSATFERLKHLISPITGPLAYLHPMPRRHSGMRKVYVAGYMVCPQDTPRTNNFDKICAGKGQSDEQARTSALCEALERFSGVYQGDEARVRGSMATLGEQHTVHFNALQNFSPAQYDQREHINRATTDRRRQVPERFTPETTIDWTPAWSLTTGAMRYVPLNYCYAEAPLDAGCTYGIHNPNGAAAGNSLEEAILQGFLELVERDATAIWWYNRISMPIIDLASFADPYFERLQQDYAAIGWQLWVLDLTHDLGIAVCAAVAYHPSEHRYAIGFGCHLDAALAVQRALTEVNQLFDPSGTSPAPWDPALLTRADFLHPTPHIPRRHARDMPTTGGTNLQADIEHCATTVAAHGMDMLVVNKTRPDIDLRVAQVIVPGLRHFWPRLDAGRLYTVPVAMQWQTHPTPENELNPAPLFL